MLDAFQQHMDSARPTGSFTCACRAGWSAPSLKYRRRDVVNHISSIQTYCLHVGP